MRFLLLFIAAVLLSTGQVEAQMKKANYVHMVKKGSSYYLMDIHMDLPEGGPDLQKTLSKSIFEKESESLQQALVDFLRPCAIVSEENLATARKKYSTEKINLDVAVVAKDKCLSCTFSRNRGEGNLLYDVANDKVLTLADVLTPETIAELKLKDIAGRRNLAVIDGRFFFFMAAGDKMADLMLRVADYEKWCRNHSVAISDKSKFTDSFKNMIDIDKYLTDYNEKLKREGKDTESMQKKFDTQKQLAQNAIEENRLRRYFKCVEDEKSNLYLLFVNASLPDASCLALNKHLVKTMFETEGTSLVKAIDDFCSKFKLVKELPDPYLDASHYGDWDRLYNIADSITGKTVPNLVQITTDLDTVGKAISFHYFMIKTKRDGSVRLTTYFNQVEKGRGMGVYDTVHDKILTLNDIFLSDELVKMPEMNRIKNKTNVQMDINKGVLTVEYGSGKMKPFNLNMNKTKFTKEFRELLELDK